MATLPIITFPHPCLRKGARPISVFDDDLRRLLDDMVDTMKDAPGIGLAAPQIGVAKRVLVMNCSRDETNNQDTHHIINPEIVWVSEEESVCEEGCLSIPQQYAEVTRPAEVHVRYQDGDGKNREQQFSGLEATCVQHEIDHLDGILFWDYLSITKRSMMQRKLKKLLKEHKTNTEQDQS